MTRLAPRLVSLALLVVLLAGGLCLRAVDLSSKAVWFDELICLLAATGQTKTWSYDVNTLTVEQLTTATEEPIVPGLRTGFTPATIWAKNRLANVFQATENFDRMNGLLFNVVLHYWIALAGFEDVELKALSVLFGTAVIAAVFLGLRAAGVGLPGATLAGLFTALHPLLIWSSREVRPYAMAALLVVLATLLLVEVVKRSEEGRPVTHLAALYVVAAVAALLTHYLAIAILAGQSIWMLLTVRNRRAWIAMICAGAIVSGLFAVWLATAGADGLKVMGVHNQLWLERARSGQFAWLYTMTLANVLDGILGHLVWRVLLQDLGAYEALFSGLPIFDAASKSGVGWTMFAAALLFLAVVSVWAARQRGDRHERLKSLMLILAASGPLAAALLAWRSGHNLPFIARYMVMSAPFAAAFLGLCAADLIDRTYWRRPLVVLLPIQALLCAMAVSYLLAPGRLIKSATEVEVNFDHKTARDIAAKAGDDDVVVYATPFDAVVLSLYLRDRPNLRSVLEDHPPAGRPAVMIRRGTTEIPIIEKLPR